MPAAVHGLHHVTAVSAQIERNVDFYTGILGLRLIKKSINQDDVSAYHLFYADGAGTPGTDLTFFDWPLMDARRPGIGTVSQTSLRVPGPEAIDWWAERLRSRGVETVRGQDPDGRAALSLEDFEGQRLRLVDDAGLPGDARPWAAAPGVPEPFGYRGLLSVTLQVRNPEPTAAVLTGLLGFVLTHEDTRDGVKTYVFEARGDASVGQVCVEARPDLSRGSVGAGGVHHVAFRVPDDAALRAFQERIEAAGVPTSGYVDRYYFHSLYFREPAGILYELATDVPGMDIDEPLETAGSRLSIPPFLEHQRASIEANLKPLPDPARA